MIVEKGVVGFLWGVVAKSSENILKSSSGLSRSSRALTHVVI